LGPRQSLIVRKHRSVPDAAVPKTPPIPMPIIS
jgi:hypothetical protein